MLLLDGTESWPTALVWLRTCTRGDYLSVKSKGVLYAGEFHSFENGSIYLVNDEGRRQYVARWKGAVIHRLSVRAQPTQEQP